MKKFITYNSVIAGAILAVGLLGPAVSHADPIPCTSVADSGKSCGYSDGWYITTAQCTISGAQTVGDPSIDGGSNITVLGGQVCGVGSASDQAGYYKDGTGVHQYLAGRPAGWNYSITTPYRSPMPSAIPPGEFVDPSDPYDIERFFPGDTVDVAFSPGDDAGSLTIGGNTISYTTGCLGNWSSQSGPQCTTETGPVAFPANPGDPISFTVINAYAPNGNGVGKWADDQIQVSFQLTACSSANYLQQGGYTDVVDYHPTSKGQCTPAVPTIDSTFQASGQSNVTINLTPGQSQTVNFNYIDNGQANSKAVNVNCQVNGLLPGAISVGGPNCSTNSVNN